MPDALHALRPLPQVCPSPRAPQRALHLIVHGGRGGEVPEYLLKLAEAVRRQRSSTVALESLSQGKSPSGVDGDLWVVPLLLLPGSHTRIDVPDIGRRLQQSGRSVRLLPFLGAWPIWLDMLEDWIGRQVQLDQSPAALLHHPLRTGIADRYLSMLQRRLRLPLLPFDYWQDKRCPPRPSGRLLLLALAPNRMSDAIQKSGRASAPLECPQIRRGLTQLLSSLP